MAFIDRVPTQPNRYKLTRADGTIEYITLERADEPTVTGTPLNARNLNTLMSKSGGTFTGDTIHTIGSRIEWDKTYAGGCLRNINVKDSTGTTVATDRIIMHRK